MQGDIKVATYRRRRSRAEVLLRVGATFASAALLIFLAVTLAMAAWHMYGRMALAGNSEEAALHQLQDVKTQQAQVASDLQNLSTERGVEGELRQRYGVAKPGEGVIKIVQPAAATTTATQSSTSFFSRVWRLFFP